ncbi:hypothetical protein ACVWWK_008074 [Bradyrhizobium sp. LB9.1b]
MLPHWEGARERGQEAIGVEANQKNSTAREVTFAVRRANELRQYEAVFHPAPFRIRKALLVSLEQDNPVSLRVLGKKLLRDGVMAVVPALVLKGRLTRASHQSGNTRSSFQPEEQLLKRTGSRWLRTW